MEIETIYNKLEQMSEQIAKIRETSARTEGVLKEALLDNRHLQDQVDGLIQEQSKWKGAMVVISLIFSSAATLVSRYIFKP